MHFLTVLLASILFINSTTASFKARDKKQEDQIVCPKYVPLELAVEIVKYCEMESLLALGFVSFNFYFAVLERVKKWRKDNKFDRRSKNGIRIPATLEDKNLVPLIFGNGNRILLANPYAALEFEYVVEQLPKLVLTTSLEYLDLEDLSSVSSTDENTHDRE